MGKQSEKKKKQVREASGDAAGSPKKSEFNSPKTYDNDTQVFISMAQVLKDEGNKLFQKRDLEGAMLKFEKAIKLLPKNHIDVSHVRSNMAACYMQLGISEYPRAIQECNLALQVAPKYSKALLKRARCYEALNRLDLAFRDVSTVVNMEPNNVMALEILERVKSALQSRGLKVTGSSIELPPDYVEPAYAAAPAKEVKDKARKKKNSKTKANKIESTIDYNKDNGKNEQKAAKEIYEEKAENGFENCGTEDRLDEKNDEVKEVVEEKTKTKRDQEGDVPKKNVKLIFGEDIRWALVPVNCSLLQLRQVIHERFPRSGAVLVKYRDQEGDLVTITSDEELRMAEGSAGSEGCLRLYVVEIIPENDPYFVMLNHGKGKPLLQHDSVPQNGCLVKGKELKVSSCVEDWTIHFAQLFKNHIGSEFYRYLNIHEVGYELYYEALEEMVTSEEAQGLFDTAGEKFQEMGALALLNSGNVHMSMARKRVFFIDNSCKENLTERIRSFYDWAQKEYMKAGDKYKEAVTVKEDFYEGFLALGQQQFERAKLSWYHAISKNVDPEALPSTEVLQLYNSAEDNVKKGMQLLEESEEMKARETTNSEDSKCQLQKIGWKCLFKNISPDETSKYEACMRSQMNLLCGSMLYERSMVEFKLGLPAWQESLQAAVEKFKLTGASPNDIAVMMKNHSSNSTSIEGSKVEDVIKARNEMFDARKLQTGILSFRLEPLFRRRVSKVYHALELS